MRNVYPGKCAKCGVLFNGKQSTLRVNTLSTSALLTVKEGNIVAKKQVTPMPIEYRCSKCGTVQTVITINK